MSDVITLCECLVPGITPREPVGVKNSSTTQPGLAANSSAESELRALTRSACDATYAKLVLSKWGIDSDIVLWCDASAALSCAKKLTGSRLKNVRSCEGFIRNILHRRLAKAYKIKGLDNPADLLTKHTGNEVFRKLAPMTGFRKLSPSELSAPIIGFQRVNQISDLQSPDTLLKEHNRNSTEATLRVAGEMGKNYQRDIEKFMQCWKTLNLGESLY